MDLAEERYDFGCTEDGHPYAVPRPDGPVLNVGHVVRLLRGGQVSLRTELAAAYRADTGKVPGQQALTDALSVIEGMAHEAEPRPVAIRVAADEYGTRWLDLGDKDGRVVVLKEAGGWEVLHNTDGTMFRRTKLTGALPVPLRGGQLDRLWSVLNVAAADRPLVLGWLVAAIICPDIPHPVLALFGEQGTGKSSACRRLVSLVDPSPVPLRKPPKEPESWVTAALGSWVVGLDNLSAVPDWLSDSLCRAVTGDGDVRRQLYTDDGLAVFAFRRAVILNGIDVGALRGDLADRTLTVNLDVIPERDRLPESELDEAWELAYPLILGALLDQCCAVLLRLPSVRLGTSPRMADFARILAALDQINGSDGLARYLGQARSLAEDTIDADSFLAALRKTVTREFTGTSADLLAHVEHRLGGEGWRAPKDWPSSRTVTALLRRNAPGLRRLGWTVETQPRSRDSGVLRWHLRPEGCEEKAAKPPAQSAHPADARIARMNSPTTPATPRPGAARGGTQ
ncbi:hypothetical protein AB3X52_04600 [Nocardioides sp. DS6]|uniref:ATP-binding protein n=1 Tax=Nocardioides eburneus TaxID=3231482 RepID=A0ABV3SVC5_9ACTN